MNRDNTFVNHFVPTEFFLGQNYPNPFFEKTIIKFCIPFKTTVKLQLLSAGKMLKTLLNKEKEAGTYEVEVDCIGLDEGVYLYRIQVADFICAKTLNLIKK